MKEKIGSFLQYIGYFHADTSLPEFTVYFLPQSSCVEVVTIVDYQKEIYLSQEVYGGIREKFIQSFRERGFTNVHMLTLVLCKEISQIEAVFEKDSFCWYVNIMENVLYVPEGHVEDFYGLKTKITDILSGSEVDTMAFYADERTLKESENPKSLRNIPFVNIAIVLINVILFILCAFTQDMLYNKGAFSIFLIEETKQYYRFLTSVFLHVDIDHLFSNMIVLYFLGNSVEDKLGHFKYGVLYFVTAIAGNVASAIYEVSAGQIITSVGASGAVFGIVGAVLMLVFVQGGKWENITLPRMLIMLAYSLYSGFISENVNNAAHIGGFLMGLLIMGVFYFIQMALRKKEVFHEN